jgi:hypothetical protein
MTTEEYVAALVAKAPPLSQEKRDRLFLLLAPYRRHVSKATSPAVRRAS